MLTAGLPNGSPGDRGKVYEITQSQSAQLLGPGRWARVGVIGEGSCFFHCLCQVTNRDNYLFKNAEDQMKIAHTLRCATFKEKFTKEAYAEFKKTTSGQTKTYDELLTDFCKPNVWADEVMIKQACKLLGYNILFIDLSSEKMQCNVRSKQTFDALKRDNSINEPTILVAWVSRSHFEPIVKIMDSDTGRIRSMFNSALSDEDYSTLKYITDRMATDCRIH